MNLLKLIQIAALILGLTAPAFGAGDFRASVVKVDITPDPDTPHWLAGYFARQSTGVHDRLYHRIVVMHDGVKIVEGTPDEIRANTLVHDIYLGRGIAHE